MWIRVLIVKGPKMGEGRTHLGTLIFIGFN